MQKKVSGFSLVELMIVVTIIGILAAIALPSYRDYVKRARFAEVIAATEPYKTAVALALQQGVALSELKNGVHGIPKKPEKTINLESIVVDKGVITATATPAAGDFTLILTPPEADEKAWSMGGTCKDAGMCND